MKTFFFAVIILSIPVLALGQQSVAPVSDGMIYVNSCYSWTVLTSESTIQSRYLIHGYPSVDISAARAYFVFDLQNIPDDAHSAQLSIVGSGTGQHDCYAFTTDSPSINTNWFDFSVYYSTYKIGPIIGSEVLSEILVDITEALLWSQTQGARYLGIRISCPITPQSSGRDLWFYASESEPANRPRIIIDGAVAEDSHSMGEVKSMFR